MDIYTASTGVQMTIWRPSEEAYQKGREFLVKMRADCGPPNQTRERPEFFYLQDREQLRSLMKFRKSFGKVRS